MTTIANAAQTTNTGRALRTFDVLRFALRDLRQRYHRGCDMRHLMELDDYLLRDVGITRTEVARAAGRIW